RSGAALLRRGGRPLPRPVLRQCQCADEPGAVGGQPAAGLARYAIGAFRQVAKARKRSSLLSLVISYGKMASAFPGIALITARARYPSRGNRASFRAGSWAGRRGRSG